MNTTKTTPTNPCRFPLAALPEALLLAIIATILCPVPLEQWLDAWRLFNELATQLLDWKTSTIANAIDAINTIQQWVGACLRAFCGFTDPEIKFCNGHSWWSAEEADRFRTIVEEISAVPAVHELISESCDVGGRVPVYVLRRTVR
jgi:hypothetical protein